LWQDSSSLKQDEGGDDDSDSDKGGLLMAASLNGHGNTDHHVAEYSRGELIRELGAHIKKEDSMETIEKCIRQALLLVHESV
jgi:hypothetical protein